jgi:NAD(P)-dependent dehydrogenase (short-subunit alcohol dehydrogenase family)
MKARWTVEDIGVLKGRRALITGANSGLGWETALTLANKGAEIVITARTEAKGKEAALRIARLVPGAVLIPEVLDLADLQSIHKFVRRFSQRFGVASLDLMINNAGVMAIPNREVTRDGFERQFATNYLGPFAATALLYDCLKPVSGTRIVNISSAITKWSRIDFTNLQSENKYHPFLQAYGQSKLADLIFSLELQRRLSRIGSPIMSIAAHPGYALTNLQKSGPGGKRSFIMVMSKVIEPVLSQNAAQGALSTLFAATAEDAKPGGYYGPDGMFEMKGYPVEVQIPAAARDLDVAHRLWAASERLTRVSFQLLN